MTKIALEITVGGIKVHDEWDDFTSSPKDIRGDMDVMIDNAFEYAKARGEL